MDYDKKKKKKLSQINALENVEKIHPMEIFQDFYQLQNNQDMSKEQKDVAISLISSIWGGEE